MNLERVAVLASLVRGLRTRLRLSGEILHVQEGGAGNSFARKARITQYSLLQMARALSLMMRFTQRYAARL
jgi:hypothetical protein